LTPRTFSCLAIDTSTWETVAKTLFLLENK
jgi:hypothetical protein